MSAFVVVTKILLTIFFSVFAGISAAKSVESASCNKRKIDTTACGIVIGIGALSGLFAIVLPVGWPVQMIFITTYIVMQIINSEGKNRATSWSLLSLLSGIMLVLGVIAWQDAIHGLKAWMLGLGIGYAVIPILIGLFKGFKLEHLNSDEGKVARKLRTGITQNTKTVLAAVFLCICVAGFISAIAWAVS